MDRKLVDRVSAAAHGGCGHAFHPSSPSWFQSTHESTHYAPPAHVADVQFYAHACVSIERSPPIPISLSLYNSSYRLRIQLVPSIHQNIEEIVLPFGLRDGCFFVTARRKIFADFIFNSVLRCEFTLIISHSKISININFHVIIYVFKYYL